MDGTRCELVYVLQEFPERSQTFVQNELRELRRRGLRPRVFVLEAAAHPDPTATDLPHEPVPPVSLAMIARGLSAVVGRDATGLARAVSFVLARPAPSRWRALGQALALVSQLGRRPDRIHVHFLWHAARVGLLASLLLGSRFSVTTHARDLFVPNADARAVFARSDPPVTVCEYNRRHVRTRWPETPDPAVVVCGVEPEHFTRTRRYRRDPFTVLSVARLVEKKGLDDLVRAVAHMRQAGHDVPCRIVGDGPEAASVRRLAADMGVADLVSLPGAVSPDEVRKALESASVFCLPSVVADDGDRDSQPVVVKEAMAMEVPVVTTSEVGLPEVVDEEIGRLVPPRAPVALADALRELSVADEGALRAMGEAGRRRIEERFSLTVGVDALVEAWCGQRAARR